jgi:hypothetical protein
MAFGGNVFEPDVPVEVVEEAEKRTTADAALEAEIDVVEGHVAELTTGVPGVSTEREAGKEYEPSATAATTVYLSIKLKAEKSAWEVLVDGKPVYTDASETLLVADLDQTYGFRVKAKGKWELKMVEGTAAEVHSVYQEG